MSKVLRPYMLTESIELRNRIIMAPMTTWSAQADGQVSIDELDYYRVRSAGVGMVITGTTYTIPNGMGFENQFYGGHDLYTKSLGRLAQAIHMGNSKAVLQMFHAGRMSSSNLLNGNQVVSASTIKSERSGAEEPRALSEGEIHNIIDSFYEATRRAIEAGFDGVEIHGANTYLIQQFFSPHSNRRDDYWGGDIERRMRFPIGIISAVKRAVKDFAKEDFVIGYRLSPEEVEEPGITIDDTLNFVNILCNQGLTYLSISLSAYDQKSKRPGKDKIPLGKRIVDMVNGRMPLMGSGGVTDMDQATAALEFGYDMIQLGRSLVMNPDWVVRAQKGKAIRQTLKVSESKALYIPNGLMEKIKSEEGWFPLVD